MGLLDILFDGRRLPDGKYREDPLPRVDLKKLAKNLGDSARFVNKVKPKEILKEK